VPRLFAGRLPDLNLGSNGGASADAGLVAAAMAALEVWPRYSRVLDGRFRGGYITRHYGQPHEGTHALQLEMAQSVYMQESPPVFDEGLAAAVEPLLRRLAGTLLEWRP
jgi:N-formylglutamate amidohydrolase